MSTSSIIKKTVLVTAIILVLFLTGPSIKIDENIKPVLLPHDLDRYVQNQEATCCEDIKPSANKLILWASPKKKVSDYSLVYIHGFTASRREISPVVERVAKRISANVFFTRLRGHGRRCLKATRKVETNDWLNDTAEAVEIGRHIGKNVVLIGTSTGAALGINEIHRKSTNIKAIIMISPNFEPSNKNTLLMLLPWGRQLALLINGKYVDNTSADLKPIEKEIWTHKYSTRLLFPMIGTIKLLKKIDLSQINIPAMVIYSPKDQVADQRVTMRRMAEWGGIVQYLEITDSTNVEQHVITGQVGDPSTIDFLVDEIVDYISALR